MSSRSSGWRLAWILAAGLAAGAAAAAEYTILDLDPVGGALGPTMANAINASGQVAGLTYMNDWPHAFLNDLTGLYDLGALDSSANISQAMDINDAGQLVGYSQTRFGQTHGWIYTGGRMIDLGTLGGRYSHASGINNAGQVVGQAQLPSQDPRDPFMEGPIRAFLYSDGVMREPVTFGGAGSSAQAINNRGQIAGNSGSTAVVWENSVMRSLGIPPGYTDSTAHDLNDAGQVVGQVRLWRGDRVTKSRAYLHDGTTMRELGTFGGAYSEALGINNAGQVVGSATLAGDQERHAFLYSGGRLIDLNSLLPPGSGWLLFQARAINDAGQIVGAGMLGGRQRAFLMTPGVDPRALPPQAPTGLAVRTVSSTQLDLTWTDNSNNEHGVEIEWLRNGAWQVA